MTQSIEKALLRNSSDDPWELFKLGSILRRRLLLLITVGAVVTAGVVCRIWLQPPLYRQEFQLLLDSLSDDNNFNPLSDNQRKPYIPPQFRDFKTEMGVLTSYKIISPLLPEIQNRYPDLTYPKLVKKLRIKQIETTAIIEVSYQDNNSEKTRFVLDKLANRYTAYSLEKLQISTNQALKLVENQLPQLKKRVDQLQGELQLFRRTFNIVDPEQQSKILTERLSEVVQQKQETWNLLGETQSTLKNLQQQLGMDVQRAIALATLSEDPRYLALLEELQKLDTKLASESSKLTEGHPAILDLREKRQRLLPLIKQEVVTVLGSESAKELKGFPAVASSDKVRVELIQKLIETGSQLKGLETRQEALAVAETQARQKLQQFAAVARQYADLSRNLEIANQSLNRFLAAKENLQIETARKVSPWQVISRIEAPRQPISPNKPRDLLLGTLAGLLAGIGAVILAEKLNNKYHSPEELQNETELSVLGTIPFHKELKTASNKFSRNGTPSNSQYWEAYISLQTNLDFLQPDKPLKSLVISSALPAEGKSTIAFYLAQAAAVMGKRVLLIDADLRRPSIHQQMGLTNIWGLSNLISSVSEAEQFIQSLPEVENLFVLTAGQTPPNPTQLLSSNKMKDLLARFQKSFDLVIFDTPPLHGFADGKVLAAQTDGVLLVVGLDKTEKAAVKRVLNDLQISHATVLGAVANGIKGYKLNYSGYYHYYYSNDWGKGKRGKRKGVENNFIEPGHLVLGEREKGKGERNGKQEHGNF